MSGQPEYPDDLVTLTTAANEFEAGTIVAVLAEAGIDAVAFSTTQLVGLTDIPGLRTPVQVRRADLERAEAALRQNVADSVDLDWSEVDLGQSEEDLPVNHPHVSKTGSTPMPLVFRLGYVLAVALMLLGLLAAAMSLLHH